MRSATQLYCNTVESLSSIIYIYIYIWRSCSRQKSVAKTWRISIPKVPLRSLDSCCQPLTMAQVLVGTEFTPPPDTTLTFEGTRTSKPSKIVLQASFRARICHIIGRRESRVFILVALARVNASNWFNIMTRLASFYRK